MSFQTAPLRFPENLELYVKRYLRPYHSAHAVEQDISATDLVSRLATGRNRRVCGSH